MIGVSLTRWTREKNWSMPEPLAHCCLDRHVSNRPERRNGFAMAAFGWRSIFLAGLK